MGAVDRRTSMRAWDARRLAARDCSGDTRPIGVTRRALIAITVTAAVAIAGCGSDDDEPGATGAASALPGSAAPASGVTSPSSAASGEQRFPDVVDAAASGSGGTWTFVVTISSPYDTPDRYADGWRVLGPDGEVYGEHMLTHDHAGEQPFTRTQVGVEIPDGVDAVTIEGRDLVNGYGGATATVELATP